MGPAGPAGPAGASGKVEVVTCKAVTETTRTKVKGKLKKQHTTAQRCTGKLMTSVKFTTTGNTTAKLAKNRRAYASGIQLPDASGISLLLTVPTGAKLPTGTTRSRARTTGH